MVLSCSSCDLTVLLCSSSTGRRLGTKIDNANVILLVVCAVLFEFSSVFLLLICLGTEINDLDVVLPEILINLLLLSVVFFLL